MNYATAWMVRYASLEDWKEAYEEALSVARNKWSSSTKMIEDLRNLYWEIRDYLIDDNRREMYETLDVLFDRLYLELDEGIKIGE
jgi:hypothetical protein